MTALRGRPPNKTDQPLRWFGRNVLLLAGATGFGQLLAFAAAPLLTRLYGPEMLGQFAFFAAAIAVICPLASLRYEWAFLVATDEDTALDLLALVGVLITASLIVFSLLVSGASSFISLRTGLGINVVLFFPLSLAVFSLNNIAITWLLREQAFSEIAAIRLTTPLAVSAIQIGLGSLHFATLGLISGFTGGYLVALLFRARIFHHALATSVPRLRIAALWHVAIKYRAFATISAPSNVINGLGAQFPSLAFPWLYGVAVTGQYSLARRILGPFGDLMSRAVNQVYISDCARLFVENPAKLRKMFIRLTIILSLILMPSLMLIWCGPFIFSMLFGPAWREAGRFAAVMVIANCVDNIAQGTTGLATFGLNHWVAAWEITRLALVGSALLAAWQMDLAPLGCAIALSAATVIAAAVLLALNGAALARAERRARFVSGLAPGAIIAEKPL